MNELTNQIFVDSCESMTINMLEMKSYIVRQSIYVAICQSQQTHCIQWTWVLTSFKSHEIQWESFIYRTNPFHPIRMIHIVISPNQSARLRLSAHNAFLTHFIQLSIKYGGNTLSSIRLRRNIYTLIPGFANQRIRFCFFDSLSTKFLHSVKSAMVGSLHPIKREKIYESRNTSVFRSKPYLPTMNNTIPDNSNLVILPSAQNLRQFFQIISSDANIKIIVPRYEAMMPHCAKQSSTHKPVMSYPVFCANISKIIKHPIECRLKQPYIS